jgi:uncharacterized membrane protein
MWGCDYNAGVFQSGGYFFNNGFITLLFIGGAILLVALILKYIIPVVKEKYSEDDQDTLDSLRLLKIRYAQGKISEEEYHSMYNVLIL